MSQPVSAKLPKEQEKHLRDSLRHLDNRNYDRCHKDLDQIFRKFPDSADALAVKALAVQQQQHQERDQGAPGRKGKLAASAAAKSLDSSDAPAANPYDICKAAITSDMKCVLAWMSMGTLHRSDKNWAESLKAFRQAFRVETMLGPWPDGTPRLNLNLMRDLTSAAVQTREWDVLIEARQRALNTKSTARANWVVYMAAHYMAGHVELASALCDTICKVMDCGDEQAERNELLLFRAQLKLELGKPQEAIPILNGSVKGETSSQITDRSEKNKMLAKAYVAAKQKQQARKMINELLAVRDSERDMLFLLAQVEGFDVEPVADPNGGLPRAVPPHPQFVALLDEMAAKYKRCDAARRLALDYCEAEPADAFTKRLTEYILYYVKNFVPSLVTVLESLYVSKAKVALIEKLFLGWKEKLEKGDESDFASADGAAAAATSDADKKNPCLLLSVYEFLAAHYRLKGEYDAAHQFIDKAIEHTPTYEMLYLAKARIYNAQGNHKAAAQLADKAQLLDLQDKYLNNKAAQYLIRSGDIETAEKRMALFFKPSTQPDVYLHSMELQYTWYEKELGAAYLAKGDLPNALRALTLVEKHQEDNHEELADFHNYTLRRNNVRQWVDVIKTEDSFDGTSHFLAACPWIVRLYLAVFDLAQSNKVADGEQLKKVAFDESRHTPRSQLTYDDEAEQRRMDKFRDQLWNVEKHWDTTFAASLSGAAAVLDGSLRYVRALTKYRINSFEAHELAFEVHSRAGRLLLSVGAVAELKRIAGKERRGPVDAADKIAALVKRLQAMLANSHDARVVELAKDAMAKF